MPTDRIYLDHQATTPVDPRVKEEMLPWLGDRWGHPSSPHHPFGWDAEKALETARARVADLCGTEPREIVFTSGGAEADALAILGAAEARLSHGRHLLTSTVERTAVRDAFGHLARQGWTVEAIGVDGEGRIDLDALTAHLRDDTALVSIQLANPETGTLQDVRAVADVCGERGTWLHVDATSAVGWVPVDVRALGVHLLSLTGHLFHGPSGIGALYVRRRAPRVRLVPRVFGGGTEQPFRGGTVNLPGAIGLGRAAEIARSEGAADAKRLAGLRDRLERHLMLRVEGVGRLGALAHRLPHTSALTIQGVEGEALVLAIPSVAFATGSACTSATMQASHVLTAMGLSKEVADTNVRFGLGRFTDEAAIEAAVDRIADAVDRLRMMG